MHVRDKNAQSQVMNVTEAQRRRLLAVFTLVGLAALSAQGLFPVQLSAAGGGEGKNVIVMGWDAAQRDHLYEMLDREGELPNLKALIAEGALVNITVIDHRTDTKSGWVQVNTGYRWWRTGSFANNIFYHAIPNNYTVFERVKARFGGGHVYTAMITGKYGPLIWPESPVMGYPYNNALPEIDMFDVDGRNASDAGALMLRALDNWRNSGREWFYGFFHFREPDNLGHNFGENSPMYEEGIRYDDEWLGKVVQKLKAMNKYNETLIYITPDHGFDEGTTRHRNAPYIWLATNDARVERNENRSWCNLVDIAPTALYGMGLNLAEIRPLLDGYPLQEDLPVGVEAERETAFIDSEPPSASITFPASGIRVKEAEKVSIRFEASDENLAAVVLLIDDNFVRLYDRGGRGNWSQNEEIEVTGSYEWDTAGVREGIHNITIVAFDAGPNPLPPAAPGAPVESLITVTVEKRASPGLTLGLGLAVLAAIAVAVYVIIRKLQAPTRPFSFSAFHTGKSPL